MGSVFHGALMELIGPDWAGVFHRKGMRPYSQAVFWNEQARQNLWRLGFLETSAASVMLPALERTKSLALHQQGYDVGLGRIRCRSIPLDGEQAVPGPVPMGAEIRFLTTTSFKRSGAYVLFPEPELLYQSILQRWPLMTGETLEKGLHQVLSYYTIIQDYDLHTEFFGLEGHGVKGFAGSVRLRFGGPERVRQMAALLLRCGSAAGFGIKTALGMGASQVRIVTGKEGHLKRRRGG
ncbi:CRISPR system precrRNA processing endoribonuclease RAMP protein Cas6 [Megasphaera sp. DISK 18]|uniref:CRISPR system precrRNA processing endoribonuclease RAMP protein Cas6 n=1 Tax=Megasphaera sp. DISK 18 TaxID=1776081 RepID=UPI000806F80A|nr:CRISPR system precrRNA processing endoribonuclease RAMP protein Cas6 [Megasphaera sp. DISK 18]OBZ32261.1 hypothetical protein A0U42_01930 [Megasphaera sp. DISK 18]